MGHNRNLADQIAGLEDNDAVESELAKLKARMSGGNQDKTGKENNNV
jgi:phage shock protein A